MTAEMMAVLRPVFEWARAHGWDRDVYSRHYRGPRYRLIVDPDGWMSLRTRDTFSREAARFRPESPQQAVDVLCALGVLPAELSRIHRQACDSGFRLALEVAWLAYHPEKPVKAVAA